MARIPKTGKRKKSKSSPTGPGFDPSDYALYLDRDKQETRLLDVRETCRHLAWRIAHFLDDARSSDKYAKDFFQFMSSQQIRVAFRKNENEAQEMLYELIGMSGIAIPACMICPEASSDFLREHISGFNDHLHDEIRSGLYRDLDVIPETASAEQPAFFHKPTTADLKTRSEPIRAAMKEGLEQKYLGSTGGHVLSAMKEADFDTSTKIWSALPYSKTFFALPDGRFAKRENSQKSTFFFNPISAPSIDEAVDQIFGSGSFTTVGKPVFLEKFRGLRRKETKTEIYKFGPEGNRREPMKSVKDKCVAAFGTKDGSCVAWLDAKTYSMGTILDQRIRALPLDIDDFELSREYNLETELGAAFEEVRSALPHAFQGVRYLGSLSSSAGMHGSGSEHDKSYSYDPNVTRFRGRFWFELDEPIEPVELKKMMVEIDKDLVDGALYSANQPIYGDPVFVGADDPLAGRRKLVVEGESVLDTGLLRAEYESARLKNAEINRSSRPSSKSTASHQMRAYRDGGGLISDAVAALQLVGDRHAMHAATKETDHFKFLRSIVNAHLFAIYNRQPWLEPLSADEVVDPDPDTPLGAHIETLNYAAHHAMIAAFEDPEKITSQAHLDEYGIIEGGLDPRGKWCKLVIDANKYAASVKATKSEEIGREVRAATEATPALLRDYRSKCLFQDTAIPGVHIEWLSGWPVINTENGIYILDLKLSEDQRMCAIDPNQGIILGSDRHLGSRIDALEFLNCEQMIERFETEHFDARSTMFVAGRDHNDLRRELHTNALPDPKMPPRRRLPAHARKPAAPNF
ncbi:hypothetical protein ACEWPM_016805 [Roseovarius sp. S4756]|uniref:hypothetical protein n=1 Tax=Roseovarius maritimus TaxID=3342637 RepID=UPI00372BE584